MSKKVGLTAIVFALLFSICWQTTAQEISEKKELSVFKLSYYDQEIPDSALGSIDEEIKGVFINLRRFDVIGMAYRLSDNDVSEFIDKVKEFKGENVEIPEKFQMGHEVFTEKDMNKLIGSFYVVVPAVTHFSVVKKERKLTGGGTKISYDSELKTSFTIVDVQAAKSLAQFFVETEGSSDESPDRAAQSAIDGIPMQLEFEVKKVPEFTLKTAVLERRGPEVVTELGQNMGILPGDEYMLLTGQVLDSGRAFETETGLIVIKEVGEDVSLATVLYGEPEEGDQLKEVPRLGFESTPYFNILINPFDQFRLNFVAGLRMSLTKGLYTFRPIAGFEFPLPIGTTNTILPWLWIAGFPFNIYLGGEVAFYLGRLQIFPQAAVGAGFLVPWLASIAQQFVVSHIGGYANLNINYLITRDIKLTLDLGYKHWISIWDVAVNAVTGSTASYGGFMIVGGVTIKF